MKILIQNKQRNNETKTKKQAPKASTIHCIIIPDKVHVLNTYTHEQHRG